MKKWTRMILLGAVFTVLLCTSALAAGEKGMYGVTGNGVTLTPKTAAQGTPGSATVNIDGVDTPIFVDAERVAMTVSTAADGTEYLVFVLKGDTTTPITPTVDNIVYIDQKSGTTAGTFDLYPSSLSSGTYSVCMSTTSEQVKKVGSFGYYAAYIPGEVDGKEGISSRDAQFVLQHSLGLRTFDETQKLAAEVDGKAGITSRDAQFILQASLGLRALS